MKRESRAGVATAFETYGNGPGRALFLHCSLASHRAWKGVIDHSSDDLTITAPDFPGHGRSADWNPAMGDFLGVATQIGATFCDGPTDVVGHSLGAAVALRLAVAHPGLVRRLVLIEPVFFAAARGTDAHRAHRSKFRPFAAALDRGDREDATRVFSNMWGGGTAFDDLPALQRQAMIDRIHLVAATGAGLEDDSGDLLAPGRLEAVTAPTLFIAGTGTTRIIREVHGALCKRMPNTLERIIDGAGHMSPLSHPQAVAGLIRDHLGSP